MNIVILGANGKVGSQVAAKLLDAGHTVIAAVHKNTEYVPSGAIVKSFDSSDQSSVKTVLNGADAVVCAMSSWKASGHHVLSSAMEQVIPAMEQLGIKRIVSISGDVARVPGESPSFSVALFHIFVFGIPKAVISDSEQHIKQLADSSLDWTVIRPGIMTAKKVKGYELVTKHPAGLCTPRSSVVSSIVDLVLSKGYVRETPFIVGK